MRNTILISVRVFKEDKEKFFLATGNMNSAINDFIQSVIQNDFKIVEGHYKVKGGVHITDVIKTLPEASEQEVEQVIKDIPNAYQVYQDEPLKQEDFEFKQEEPLPEYFAQRLNSIKTEVGVMPGLQQDSNQIVNEPKNLFE